MKYVVASLVLESTAQLLLLVGNFDYAWIHDGKHGGLWTFCSDANEPAGCSNYIKDSAEKYNHSYTLIEHSRNLMLATTIMGSPIIIISSFGLCSNFNFGPYALISLCTFCQFGTAVSLSILMTYSFVVRPDNGTQMGWALWTVWTSTAPLITIMVLMSLRTAAMYRQEFPQKGVNCCRRKQAENKMRLSLNTHVYTATSADYPKKSLSIVVSRSSRTATQLFCMYGSRANSYFVCTGRGQTVILYARVAGKQLFCMILQDSGTNFPIKFFDDLSGVPAKLSPLQASNCTKTNNYKESWLMR
ncbi:uncharacterized protein LOC142338240 isoform X2 [Convolutriloba macropyga]|uniref:uncharacterized protein LOC142338240 isoform X2 n=1 Tax=Convolutriloba macropyga TaxID=536237 RepID=UPI003F51CD06